MRAVYDLVDLQPIILAARQLAYIDETLDNYLPDTNVEDVEYRLGRAEFISQTVPPRALDTPAPVIARPGVLEARGGLPAFSAMDLLTESDLQRARRLAGLPVDVRLDVAAAAARATQTILNTQQVLKAQTLTTGGISLSANGVVQSVDFGVPSGNKVTPGTAWTDHTNATVMSDLRAWHDQYVSTAGGAPGAIVTDTPTLRHMLQNKQVISEAVGALVQRTAVTKEELNNVLAANDLPTVTTYDRSLRLPGGSMSKIWTANKLVFLPSNDQPVGETQYGITQEAVELVNNRVLTADQAPGIVAVMMVEDNPVQKSVVAAAIGMPVIQPSNAVAMLIATIA